ncbi:hypothetical protein BK120_23175 [Paenibacillus sp. FSL A5-0031]|uniref:hypothetical protein n=1 Tax=Paenibacillus sp. FSL A5-0031 TaxID=1920420 RepID=UPI00096FF6AD|nr:hypothetical protein [Paenibacillus sp. FSL A5-0031]OME78644.1 hypothetical protein BK120_23175 [Paenibacillus sp. FSL A5-0031]
MKRLFLVSDDKDFAEWIEDELSETGRFIRSIDSFDFFIPQWSTAQGADYIIFPETVITSDESLLRIYRSVHKESPSTCFLFIYHRDDDELTKLLTAEGNICVSYDDLDAGLLERLIRNNVNRKSISLEQASPILNEEKSNNTNLVENSEMYITHYKEERLVIEEESIISADKKSSEELESAAQSVTNAQQIEELKPQKKRTNAEQKEKLARIKERIIIEEKIVTIHVPVHFNSKLISLVSLYPRAGSTFITSNFARMLGENKVPVAVLEPIFGNIGSTYYELMHGEVNAPKNWISWAEQIKQFGSVNQDNTWSSHGVTWIPSPVEPLKAWSEEENMKLLLSASRYPVTLCDISSGYNDPNCKKILEMSDEIWIVADGDPVALNHHFKTIDKIKLEFERKKIRIIGNRWNQYINKSEWKEAVLLPLLTHIPDLGTIVLKQLWAGNLAWDDQKLKEVLSSPLKPMAQSVVAKEMYHLFKRQYGLGSKLRSFFREIKLLDDEVK